MSDLRSNVHIVLQGADYSTWEVTVSGLTVVAFEDESTMGFAVAFDKPDEMLGNWRVIELSILGRHAAAFRSAGDKAWNVYCVFLTEAVATDDERRQIRWIEEDLQRTRKIAAAGLATREDVIGAFLPLLPIASRPSLHREDLTARLTLRIDAISSGLAQAVLDPNVPPADVVRRLQGDGP
jgi:hypothetical protein